MAAELTDIGIALFDRHKTKAQESDDAEFPSNISPESHYYIPVDQHNVRHFDGWVLDHVHDPAFHNFIPKLFSYLRTCLTELDPSFASPNVDIIVPSLALYSHQMTYF